MLLPLKSRIFTFTTRHIYALKTAEITPDCSLSAYPAFFRKIIMPWTKPQNKNKQKKFFSNNFREDKPSQKLQNELNIVSVEDNSSKPSHIYNLRFFCLPINPLSDWLTCFFWMRAVKYKLLHIAATEIGLFTATKRYAMHLIFEIKRRWFIYVMFFCVFCFEASASTQEQRWLNPNQNGP